MGQNDPPRQQDPYVQGPGGCASSVAVALTIVVAVLVTLLSW